MLDRTSGPGIAFVKSFLVPDSSLRPTAEESLQSEWLIVCRVQKISQHSIQSPNPDAHEVIEHTPLDVFSTADDGMSLEWKQ
jgi:hypothetical protein